MRYRILVNPAGRYKVQSKRFFFSRWHERGEPFYADFHRLRWRATEFKTLREAEVLMANCKTYDAQAHLEHQWRLVKGFN